MSTRRWSWGWRWGAVAGAVGLSLPLAIGLGSGASAEAVYAEQEGSHGVNTFTNYHNASGMGPRVNPGQWVNVSCKVYDPYIQSVNPDGYWYRIADSPWSDQYYSPANTFMNGDPWGGPYTHNTDFNVPDCGSVTNPPPSTPPASQAPSPGGPPSQSPVATLAQGPEAPVGYRYAITLDNFAPNSGVSISCRDSASPGGFYSFTLRTDGAGHAFTENWCYTNDGPAHWYLANGGVESNVVLWGSRSMDSGQGAPDPPAPLVGSSASGTPPATPATAGTPQPSNVLWADPDGSPRRRQVPDLSITTGLKATPILAKMDLLLHTCSLAGFTHCVELGNHYLDGSGSSYTISLSTLEADQQPLKAKYQWWLRDNVGRLLPALKRSQAAGSLSFDTQWQEYSVTDRLDDWYWALHNFRIRLIGDVWVGPAITGRDRAVRIRYRAFMYDVYDFVGNPEYGDLAYLHDIGWAAEFLVHGNSPTMSASAAVSWFNPSQLDYLG